MTIPDEARNWARELYVIDGLSLEQTARETDIPIGTVKRWSSDDGWFEEKQQYRRQLAAIDQDTVRLKKMMTERAIETLDPQVIHAWKAIKVDRKSTETREPDIDRPKLFLEDMEFVAETLKDVDPEGLKIFARNFEIIVNRFKEAAADTRR